METIKIEIPTCWDDVTLKEYLELMSELEGYDDDEAKEMCILSKLSGLTPGVLKGLSVNEYKEISDTIANFMNKNDEPFQRFIHINGVEYGFEPNLSKMSYGAYLDITKYDTFTIDKNWADVMKILYRKVKKKDKNFYSIERYNGNEDRKPFEELPMSIHFGALFFFVNLSMDLFKGTLKSLMKEDTLHQLKQTLAENGKDTQASGV